jgi:hypothetical protein
MATPWISIIALGAALGFLGQSVRVVVGLKKARDEAAALGKTFTEAFEPSTMLVSLSMGGGGRAGRNHGFAAGHQHSNRNIVGLGGSRLFRSGFHRGVHRKVPARRRGSSAAAGGCRRAASRTTGAFARPGASDGIGARPGGGNPASGDSGRHRSVARVSAGRSGCVQYDFGNPSTRSAMWQRISCGLTGAMRAIWISRK